MEKDAAPRNDFVQDIKTNRGYPEIKVLRKGPAFDEFVCEDKGKEVIITKGTIMMLYGVDAEKEMGK